MVVLENPSSSAVFEILRPAWHQQPFHVQSYLNPPFPHSDARFELQQVAFTTSSCLVIG